MNRVFVIICLSLILPVKAFAADEQGNYAIWGPGQRSCNNYNTARIKDDYDDYKYFLMGYLTAYNTLTVDNFRVSGSLDLDAMLERLDDHCQQVQVDSYDRAIKLLISDMYDNRLNTGRAKDRGTIGW